MEPDFGTYHHSTPEESANMREKVAKAFTSLLLSLYPADSELRILDAGCGLGFLSGVAARCFHNSRVTAVDVFGHDSISDASPERAMANMRILGVDSRVEILQHDLRKPLPVDGGFDLAISSLVFHNLGKQRFNAYQNVFSALRAGGCFAIGDLFPSLRKDLEFFSGLCSTVREEAGEGSGKWAYRLIAMKKK